MRKNKQLLVAISLSIALLAGALLTSCGSEEAVPPSLVPGEEPTLPGGEEPTVPPGFKTYTVTATQALTGYCISYPEDWLIGGAPRLFVAFPTQGAPEKVLVMPVGGPLSITQIKDFFIQPKAELPPGEGYKSISVSELEVNGTPAVKHVWTVLPHGGGEGDRVKWVQTYLMGDEVFKIDYMAPVSSFDRYLSTYEQMIRSFRFLPRLSGPPEERISAFKTYNSEETVFVGWCFSISYPEDWIISPGSPEWTGPHREHVRVGPGGWGANTTVQEMYYDYYLPPRQAMIARQAMIGYTPISLEENLTINGIPALKEVFLYEGPTGETVKAMCVYLKKVGDVRGFDIILEAPVEYYDSCLPIFEKMANSFEMWGTVEK